MALWQCFRRFMGATVSIAHRPEDGEIFTGAKSFGSSGSSTASLRRVMLSKKDGAELQECERAIQQTLFRVDWDKRWHLFLGKRIWLSVLS
mmetsp:Transcript_45486/g.108137  ORF Transcript_45486/g.108137 Transcript_45486/m.108137 type:complete len:91 (+) Transcript_45486:147-419(+)